MKSYMAAFAAATLVVGFGIAPVEQVQAASLNIQLNGAGTADDVLLGVNGLTVNGTDYNVTFVDSTCSAIWGGCDSNADFDFQTASDALAAVDALADAIDNTLFDQFPEQIFGITGTSGIGQIWVPFNIVAGPFGFLGYLFDLARIVNFSSANGGVDWTEILSSFGGLDMAAEGQVVYAVFSVVPEAVSEPATLALFGLSLAGIGFARRRKV